MSCDAELLYDTETLRTDKAAWFTLLETIEKKDYEKAKEKYGLVVPGYFDGDHQKMREKLSELRYKLDTAGGESIKQDYYRRAVSDAGVRAYESCLRSNSNDPIVAAIHTIQDDSVTVWLRCGLTGGQKVGVRIFGTHRPEDLLEIADEEAAPTAKADYDLVLSANSEDVVRFKVTPFENFLVTFRATFLNGGGSSFAEVSLAAKRQFVEKREPTKKSGVLEFGAGYGGSSTGKAYCHPVIFTADAGCLLDPATFVEGALQRLNEYQIRTYRVETNPPRTSGPCRSLTAQVVGFESDQGHGMAIARIAVEITQYRDYLEDVTPKPVAASSQPAIPTKPAIPKKTASKSTAKAKPGNGGKAATKKVAAKPPLSKQAAAKKVTSKKTNSLKKKAKAAGKKSGK